MHASNPVLQLQLPIGFGFMNASWGGAPTLAPGDARDAFIAALHFAMDSGVTFFDTADIYAPSWDAFGHNEILLREAIATWSGTETQKASLLVATKGGITRGPGQPGQDSKGIGESWGKSATYDYLMKAVVGSAERLGLSEIPLWQHHRLDPNLTLTEQLANLRKLNQNAPIRHIGVSNYSAEQLRAALAEIGGPADGGIVSVQNQLNPAYRQQMDVLEVCEAAGVAYLPWSPMKGVRASDAGKPVHDRFQSVARAKGVSIFAVAQAWLRSLSDVVVPMPGVTKLQSIQDSLASVPIRLTAEEAQQLADLPETMPLDDELVRDQPLS